ncbi:MAG: lipoprotein-anchoring transpeptidase ErfK/SrfK [Verrucomicrobiales bacterium]|jgi:lipoprotein-anchoring transpeptidase ErfK/SrfK
MITSRAASTNEPCHSIQAHDGELRHCLLKVVALLTLVPATWMLGSSSASADALDIPADFPIITPEPAKEEIDTHVQVQIFLDERNFGPGKIDGAIGQFTRKAAEAYNRAQGITPVEDWGPILEGAAKVVPTPYRTYTVTKEDMKFITYGLPTSPQAQARRRYLGYRNVAEFVAERFHTDERFLAKLNKGKIRNIYGIKPGSEVKVPNVTPFLIEDIPTDVLFETDPELSTHSVIVDTKEKQATFWDSEGIILASFPITPGQKRFIHYGEWELLNMITTPTFRWDKSMLSRGKRSQTYYNLPSGPNNPVGIFWGGISKQGIGLHGTSSPHTIGRSQSAGCIRFANWDAVRLSGLIRPGSKVTIK